MSVDDRLSRGLSRNAHTLNPQVELSLEAAWARHRRARRARWAAAATGVLAAACAVLVLALTGGWWVPAPRSSVAPAKTPIEIVDLQGRYSGEVAPLPSAPGAEGPWVLDFRSNGVLEVTAPPTYPGVVSGVLYSLDQGTLRTDLFGQDLCSGQPLGAYTVSRTADKLGLTVGDDPCAPRVSVLEGTTWTTARP
ncbi:hypothetical protein [Ornithinimicrobium sp. LYQ103]|uniref:hypothetical protein n=1 Tax=Ornithinimicrobium sp. LYQ103 TaxID=3378796 RepID=UPI0038539500